MINACSEIPHRNNFVFKQIYIPKITKAQRPWAACSPNYFVSWHLSGEHLVHGLFETHAYRYIAVKNSSQTKSLSDTGETSDLKVLYYVVFCAHSRDVA